MCFNDKPCQTVFICRVIKEQGYELIRRKVNRKISSISVFMINLKVMFQRKGVALKKIKWFAWICTNDKQWKQPQNHWGWHMIHHWSVLCDSILSSFSYILHNVYIKKCSIRRQLIEIKFMHHSFHYLYKIKQTHWQPIYLPICTHFETNLFMIIFLFSFSLRRRNSLCFYLSAYIFHPAPDSTNGPCEYILNDKRINECLFCYSHCNVVIIQYICLFMAHIYAHIDRIFALEK